MGQDRNLPPFWRIRLKMSIADRQIETVDDLRAFVIETLCEHEQLEPGMFPMTERLLHQCRRTCGIEFCLHGPRSVKLMAICEIERRSLLFYNSAGQRFHRAQLADTLSGLSADQETA